MDELLYLGVFLLYTIAILILGKHGFDKTDELKGYFLAGRNLSLFPSIASFCATWFSAASLLGLPGLIYEGGVSVLWTTAIAWLLGIVGLFFLSSKLYTYNVVTVPEFFLIRYQSKLLQVWIGIVLSISYLLYVVIQIRGFGIVVSEMLEVPYMVSVFLIYIFVLYTTFGGLHSVARTDIFHFCLIVFGTILGAILVVNEIGGVSGVVSGFASFGDRGTDTYLALFPEGGLPFWTLISAFFSLGLGVAANPQYAVRILSSRSKHVALKMIFLSAFFLVLIYFSIFVIGIGSRILDPDLQFTNTDEIYPYIITYLLQTPWKGILLISVVAAAISTANSQLLIMASSFVYDITLPIRKQKSPDSTIISWTRWVIFVFATLALLIAFTPPKGIVQFSGHVWGIIAVSLFFPLYGGLYTKASRKNALLSTFGGSLAYILAFLLIPKEIQPAYHPVLPSIAVAGFLFFLKGGRLNASFYRT
ncbi:sodium:solute symporter family protein [Guptibacillus hwajinpoensis]|uniref:SSS family solute:Na+ symporter n=1 Tax=Guptibacillus hwajinpoensis TaxID=208199 RepID=A0ABU0K517_9BACL|nr:sodium:solute symporter family protein [Alkalihalobacillus hemicentroti]MDQ0483775.1 SSS family solute:Na+ symporter [Alkalihalobacillus hemicentroti]